VTRLVHTFDELDAARAELGGSIGLVPTMGALHAGHEALIRAARSSCDSVIVSVFVNPMQFNQAADLARYPRPIEADVRLCEQLGVDIVWNPDAATMYPDGAVQVWVTAGELANQLEGPNRPGHFDGVLTIVTKLFAAIRPDRAFFGEKDYQQLTIIRRMVRDLGSGVQIVEIPTVREPDGLALSSRNAFLSAAERPLAALLSRALRAGASAAGSSETVLQAAHSVLDPEAGVTVEYLELRSPDLSAPPDRGPARLLVAATIGQTRLIDNLAIELTP
jgi:pantoate--beta-alanine ligase